MEKEYNHIESNVLKACGINSEWFDKFQTLLFECVMQSKLISHAVQSIENAITPYADNVLRPLIYAWVVFAIKHLADIELQAKIVDHFDKMSPEQKHILMKDFEDVIKSKKEPDEKNI